ncbi:sterol desaturase family protein [Elioraea rosea]|uniref:sterol desaturase family protein n=1 Tax=Elioraea rosea TaxID=2492390 RepID=UPI001182F1A5|nr:sterol desaturase family protein [Elioraea rosea]
MIGWIGEAWLDLKVWIFQTLLLPGLYSAGWMRWEEDAFEWLDFALFGAATVLVSWIVCGPLEAALPVERRAPGERSTVGTDVTYTLLNRLGLVPLFAFVALQPLEVAWEALLANAGVIPLTLETMLPALRDWPLLTFALYVVILDFAEYWRHRFQHRFGWWWALHSVHHAQRQMTFWTDDRNHLIDDLIAGFWFAGVAVLIGVPPGQFPLLLLVMRVMESLSHANVRLDFGRVGGRLVVSPHFHRVHHALDHDEGVDARVHGCNFAVLLPIWDMLFGTARYGGAYPPTGDLSGSESLATGSWWGTQVEGAKRFLRALAGRA